MMALVISVVVGAPAIFGVVIGWRWLDWYWWRQSLVAYSMQFPRDLTADDLASWLAMLASLRTPVALELTATAEAISHYLMVPKARQAEVLAGTRGVLPGVRLDSAPLYISQRPPAWRGATELRLTHLSRQLAVDRAETTARALLSSFGQLKSGETVRVQWLVIGTTTPKPRASTEAAKELARAEKIKHAQPLVQAVGRVAVAAPPGRAGALLSRTCATLRLMDAPGVAVVRRSLPARLVRRRLVERAVPLTVWPLVINVREAAGLIGVPLGETIGLAGLTLSRSRPLPPGPVPSRGGTAIATSNYSGHVGQPLVIGPADRLHHVYVVGPTGVGKSNLLASMAIQDAAHGAGLALIDLKGDLVEAVTARLPAAVIERTIVLDPSQTDMPVGFNPLSVPGGDEHARDLAVDRVLHVIKDLYRANWGPRSDDLLRASLQTLVSIPAPNGHAFTICEVPELLVRPDLRRYAVAQAGLPEVLKSYWAGFNNLSDAEQVQHISPLMNKLRAFTMRTATRLMLGQSSGIDLDSVMQRQQVLLVSLAKGKLGTETALLTGSLLVASLWEAALGRARLAPTARRPFYVFLDEFQDIVRLSESLPDLLSQARGLGVGAVLANQYLAQLPDSVRAAVLGTVRSQVVFQVEYDDAKLLERRFSPSLSASDLAGLNRYEVAIRPSVGGQTALPVTGTTVRLSDPVRSADEAARDSRQQWGQTRAEVEAELVVRATDTRGPGPAGRVSRRRPS